MTKEIIDEFFDNNEELKKRIKVISANYNISDFVLFSEKASQHFENHENVNTPLSGCIFDLRDRYLLVDIEPVGARLLNEYMNLLSQLLETDDNADIVFYIVAYHYLALCKEMAYKWTIGDYAPFPFTGLKISPMAKERLDKYKAFSNESYCFVDYFDEKDLEFYNTLFWKLMYHHHSAKHFSLLEYLLDMNINIGRFDFDNSFRNLLELYIFRYRAIYTEEKLFAYMSSEAKERIINGLIVN